MANSIWLGAYAVVGYLYTDLKMPFFLAVAAGLVFVGMLGLVMERGLFRPLRNNPLGGLIASIGFLLILQTIAVLGFGVRMEHVPPSTQEKIFLTEGVVLTVQRLYVIIATVVLLGGLWVFLRKSKFGWALRACAQDPEAAALQGISLNQTARIAMFIGAALAGVAGALTAPLVSPTPHMGHAVIVTAFIIIIVGGIGSLEGAVIAAVLYAFVHTFVTTFYDGVDREHRRPSAYAGCAGDSGRPACSGPRNVRSTAMGTGQIAAFAMLLAALTLLPHVLSYSQQEVLVFLVINVLVGGELPSADTHRRMVAWPCGDGRCRRLFQCAHHQETPGRAGTLVHAPWRLHGGS